MADPPRVRLPWREAGGQGARPPRPTGFDAIAAGLNRQRPAPTRPVLPAQTPSGVVLPWRAQQNAAQVERAEEDDGGGGGFGGLLSNVGDLVTGLPEGVARTVADVGHDVVYAPLKDIAQNIRHPTSFGRYRGPERLPFVEETQGSVERTAGRVANPGRYAEAWREGDLVSAIVEDLANVSIAGSVAARPLTAASGRAAASAAARGTESALARRLASAGRVAAETGRLGGGAADAPAAPYRLAAKGVRQVGRIPTPGGIPLGQRLADTGVGQQTARLGRTLAARRTARDVHETDIRQPTSQVTHDIAADTYQATAALTDVDDRAAVVVFDRTVESPATRETIRRIEDFEGPEAADAYIERIANPEGTPKDAAHYVTPESVRTALDFYDGRLAPERAAAIGGAVQNLARMSETITELHQRPDARATGPLPPEMLESALLPSETTLHPRVVSTQQRAQEARTAATKAREAATAAEGRVEAPWERTARTAETATGRLERAGEVRGGQHVRAAEQRSLAGLFRRRADEAIEAGVAKSGALTARAEDVRAGALEQAASQPFIEREATRQRTRAAEEAEARQATAPLPALEAEQGRPATRPFRQALRHDVAGEQNLARVERELGREEALRGRAADAEYFAEAKALREEGRAVAREAQAAGIEARTPVRDVAQRELPRVARAAESLGQTRRRARELDVEAARLERRAESFERKAAAVRKAAWNRVEAAPPRWRNALHANRRAVAEGMDTVAALRSQGDHHAADAIEAALTDVPVSLAAMVDAGIDPQYLPGGLDPSKRTAPGLRAARPDTALRRRKLGSEHERQTEIRPATSRGRALLVVREAKQVMENIATTKLLDEHGVTAAGLGLNAKGSPAILDAMRERGFEPWNDGAVGPDSVFLPAELKGAFKDYLLPEGALEQAMQTFFDPVRQGWKDLTLPISGQWHVGNVISNSIMATSATGSLRWATKLGEAWKAARTERHGVTGVPARVFGSQIDRDLNAYLFSKTGKKPNIVRRGLDKSYAFNSFMDNWIRSAVYLAEHERGLGRGLGDDAARARAIDQALVANGDFSNMTRFEQQVVRRIVPFYAWSRHVTQLVRNLAVHHPARLVWTLQLPNLFNPDDTSPFRDAIGVEGGIFTLGSYNPLGQFANLYLNERGLGAGALQAIGPEIDVTWAATTGGNLGRGAQPLRLPPGFSAKDQFGNDIPTALLTRPGALARYAAQQVPLVRTAQEIAAGKRVARYDTGEPIVSGNRLIESSPRVLGTDVSGRLGILARQAGIPTATPFDVDEVTERARIRREAAAEARDRYRRSLTRAGG